MSIRVVSAFLCEKAGLGPDGKVWAAGVGIFGFASPKYPIENFAAHLVFLTEADASEIGTTHKLNLELQNADGKIGWHISADLPITMESRKIAMAKQLVLTITQPGVHQIVFKLNGKIAGI